MNGIRQRKLLCSINQNYDFNNIYLCQIFHFKWYNFYCQQLSKEGGTTIFLKQNFNFEPFSIMKTEQKDFESPSITFKTHKSVCNWNL